MQDTQLSVTADGRIAVGDRVTVTLEWAAQLLTIYPASTIDAIRVQRTGRVLEIWTGGYAPHLWTSVLVDFTAAHPWELAECLELARQGVGHETR